MDWLQIQEYIETKEIQMKYSVTVSSAPGTYGFDGQPVEVGQLSVIDMPTLIDLFFMEFGIDLLVDENQALPEGFTITIEEIEESNG